MEITTFRKPPIKQHGKEFASAAELQRWRDNMRGARYRFKDGQTGTIIWEHAPSFWGRFTSDNGACFTVADVEVEVLPPKGKQQQ